MDEKEYIEREKAINAVLMGDIDKDFPRMDIAARLHDIPAADVRPVVRGKWVEDDDEDGKHCSICGEDYCYLVDPCERYHYCPHCGADLREVADG